MYNPDSWGLIFSVTIIRLFLRHRVHDHVHLLCDKLFPTGMIDCESMFFWSIIIDGAIWSVTLEPQVT